ncbi:hypothetical protein K7G19_19785 [Cupriavidus sp. DB3]|uniref:hypothetical protein n=1 Tax=Cupriavidus sp. DB3 TaxID=2873259 RepID=UPI001CF57C5A|nr:hypothetical protein [Cupriavidus sp. DB3]MCA7085834.1 hypothetical protein [Cupriavidus sp. DB3]
MLALLALGWFAAGFAAAVWGVTRDRDFKVGDIMLGMWMGLLAGPLAWLVVVPTELIFRNQDKTIFPKKGSRE